MFNFPTMDDVHQIGLAETVEVMGNGSTVAGTCLEYISAYGFVLLRKIFDWEIVGFQ